MRRVGSWLLFGLGASCLLGAVAAVVVSPIEAFVGPGRSFKWVAEMARSFGEPVARGVLFGSMTCSSALFFLAWRKSLLRKRNAS
jgi:hypothetical protein